MAQIKIMALGGLGENGKNMYVVEVDDELFILDCGMKYPDIDMYGIDGVIPSLDYLIQNKEKIQGIFLSHGHPDNVGAIAYLLKILPMRVYGSHFTISIVEAFLANAGMDYKKFKLFRINASKEMKFKNATISFFNTSHSIPESLGIALHTVDGTIIYCTDFFFSASAKGSYQTTFDKITDLGKKKTLAVLAESINTSHNIRITNDSLLEHNLKTLLGTNPKRVIIASYSTDLIRIQKAIDVIAKTNYKIGMFATRETRIVQVAEEYNYLNIPESNLLALDSLTKEEIENLNNAVIFVCGARMEPYSEVVKMAISDEGFLKITSTDLVILMCPPVPGTEKQTTDAINTLFEHDVNLKIFDKDILRSNHASLDDLKMLYAMTKPEYIVPIKGEFRQMYEHMLACLEAGYDRNQVLLMDNGDQVIFNDGKIEEEYAHFDIDELYLDGATIGAVDEAVIKERGIMAEEGVIFIEVLIDKAKLNLKEPIRIFTRVFSYTISEEEITNSLGGLMERMTLNLLRKKGVTVKEIEEKLMEELEKNIWHYTKHRPIIVPIIVEL